MTITITPAAPHSLVGPGIPLLLQSTATIPTGVPLQWSVNWFPPGGGPVAAFHVDSFAFTGSTQIVVPWTTHISPVINSVGTAVTDDSIPLTSTLNRLDTGAAIDTGSTTQVVDFATGIPNQIALQTFPTGGLTTAQATQLQQTHDATQIVVTRPTGQTTVPLGQLFSMPTLDALTLTQVTTGPTPDFASVSLPNNAVGVIIRITSIGPGYAATSPDDSYFIPELAVARFFRGTDLVARIGIHTVSRFIYPIPGAWAEWTTTLFGGDLPPDMSVQVNFAAGNLGELFFTALP